MKPYKNKSVEIVFTGLIVFLLGFIMMNHYWEMTIPGLMLLFGPIIMLYHEEINERYFHRFYKNSIRAHSYRSIELGVARDKLQRKIENLHRHIIEITGVEKGNFLVVNGWYKDGTTMNSLILRVERITYSGKEMFPFRIIVTNILNSQLIEMNSEMQRRKDFDIFHSYRMDLPVTKKRFGLGIIKKNLNPVEAQEYIKAYMATHNTEYAQILEENETTMGNAVRNLPGNGNGTEGSEKSDIR